MRELVKCMHGLLTHAKGRAQAPTAAAAGRPRRADNEGTAHRAQGEPRPGQPQGPGTPELQGDRPHERAAGRRQTISDYHQLVLLALEGLGLNELQRSIGQLVMRSLSYDEIADQLGMTESNVRYHTRNIHACAHVPDRHGFERRVHCLVEQLAAEPEPPDSTPEG